MRRGGQSYFHLQDMLANVTALTDSAGAVVEDYAYSAFGKQATPGSALGNPFTFAGRQWDAESSTYYNRARQLDPATGRFTSEDPIRSANAYIYAGNDPVSSRDPSGLFSISELNAANSIRSELMSEQVGFGSDLIAAISGDGPSAKNVGIAVGAAAGGLAAYKVVKTIRSIRAASRINVPKLVDSANTGRHANGLSGAAHALDSDYARMDLPKPSGNVAAKNEGAATLLDEIVNMPGTRIEKVTGGNFVGGTRVVAPDGRAAVWDSDGVFRYFHW